MRDNNNLWYPPVNRERLMAQVANLGSVEEVQAVYYSYSQTPDSLTKILAGARHVAKKRTARPERPDADHIIAVAQRVSSIYLASRELGIAESTIRKLFHRRGLPVPKLDKAKLKAACLVGGAKRRAKTQAKKARMQPVSVYEKPVQLNFLKLFGNSGRRR